MRLLLEPDRAPGAVPTPQNLYALASITPGTPVQIQNQAQHMLHVFAGDTLTESLDDYFLIEPWGWTQITSDVLYAYSGMSGVGVVIQEDAGRVFGAASGGGVVSGISDVPGLTSALAAIDADIATIDTSLTATRLEKADRLSLMWLMNIGLDIDEANYIALDPAVAIGRAVITQNGTGGTGAVFNPTVHAQKSPTGVVWGGAITSTSLTPSVIAANIADGDVTLDAVIWSLLDLRCFGQGVTAIDVGDFIRLTTLYCSTNQLTALDVSTNTALTLLHCSTNQLTALDVSTNTALTHLYGHVNQLTALDVSTNTALKTLHCHTNQLTALDVSTNTALTTLNCHTNQLTALDVSTNTALTTLHCHTNQLTQASLDALLASLVTHGLSNGTLQCQTQTNAAGAAVINTGSAAATSAQTLITRGWTLTYSGTFVPA